MTYLRVVLIALSAAAGINLALYLCETFFGWDTAIRYLAGALLLLLGVIAMQSSGARSTLVTRRHTRTTLQDEDLEEFRQAQRQDEASGWLLVSMGAASLGLTLLFP